jgi:hypothetical protein
MDLLVDVEMPIILIAHVAGTQKSFTVQEGRNHILKSSNSEITVQLHWPDYTENDRLHENALEILAILGMS